jgi:hypothetical protein
VSLPISFTAWLLTTREVDLIGTNSPLRGHVEVVSSAPDAPET